MMNRRQTDPKTAISLIINDGIGVHFDPETVKAFKASRKQLFTWVADLLK